jgi:hypothetical protein
MRPGRTILQDQRIGPMSFGGDQPAALSGLTKKRRETGIRIKSRPTQPINGAVATDQCGRLAVPYDPVALNR